MKVANRLDEAEAVYQQMEARKLESEWLLQNRYILAFLKGDAAQMAQLASAAVGKPSEGGHAVIGSFALDGPEKCSGLEVRRYDGPMLALELGPQFSLLKSESEIHVTPWGKPQSFQFSLFKRL
jgi:hypothetical protein